MPILTIHQLTKYYGSIKAVDHLDLEVQPGNVFGILGPNGSGKTTTLGIILGIIQPQKGSYEWFDGEYGKNARLEIGALLETPNFYPYMDAEENLKIVAHIKKIKAPKIDELLDMVNLLSRKKSRFRTYSLGMKQRLAIASAMIGDPQVLIFDEPTNGLDPQGIAEVRTTIKEIGERGKTIIMASHILDEVEKVCSHVAIIKKGKLLATGTVGAIMSNEKTIEVAAANMDQLKELLTTIPAIQRIEQKDNLLILNALEDYNASEINLLAFKNGITLQHLVTKQKSLEAEFLEITK